MADQDNESITEENHSTLTHDEADDTDAQNQVNDNSTSCDETKSNNVSENEWKIRVRTLGASDYAVTCNASDTIQNFKLKLESLVDATSSRQRLIYCGRVLADETRLSDVEGLTDGATVHLVLRPPGVEPSPTPSPSQNAQTAQRVSGVESAVFVGSFDGNNMQELLSNVNQALSQALGGITMGTGQHSAIASVLSAQTGTSTTPNMTDIDGVTPQEIRAATDTQATQIRNEQPTGNNNNPRRRFTVPRSGDIDQAILEALFSVLGSSESEASSESQNASGTSATVNVSVDSNISGVSNAQRSSSVDTQHQVINDSTVSTPMQQSVATNAAGSTGNATVDSSSAPTSTQPATTSSLPTDSVRNDNATAERRSAFSRSLDGLGRIQTVARHISSACGLSMPSVQMQADSDSTASRRFASAVRDVQMAIHALTTPLSAAADGMLLVREHSETEVRQLQQHYMTLGNILNMTAAVMSQLSDVLYRTRLEYHGPNATAQNPEQVERQHQHQLMSRTADSVRLNVVRHYLSGEVEEFPGIVARTTPQVRRINIATNMGNVVASRLPGDILRAATGGAQHVAIPVQIPVQRNTPTSQVSQAPPNVAVSTSTVTATSSDAPAATHINVNSSTNTQTQTNTSTQHPPVRSPTEVLLRTAIGQAALRASGSSSPATTSGTAVGGSTSANPIVSGISDIFSSIARSAFAGGNSGTGSTSQPTDSSESNQGSSRSA